MFLQLLVIWKMLHFVTRYFETDHLSLLLGHYRLWAAFKVRLARLSLEKKHCFISHWQTLFRSA